jgi:type VII secretion protein EccB
MESALVRGDSVPLHEQLRSQRRAAFAGVLLGLLGLAAVGVHGWLDPGSDWKGKALVVGEGSGSIYAVVQIKGRETLVPVTNAAAGRLVLAAYGVRDGAAASPAVVEDDEIAKAPRTATAAVPGATGVRPDGPSIPSRWSVCDQISDGRVRRLTGTTVVAGAAPVAPATGPAEGLLLKAGDSGFAILDGKRHHVDLNNESLLAGLGVDRRSARPAGDRLVSAIPEGPELSIPPIPDGAPPAGLHAGIGDVLTATTPGGVVGQYVVLPGGVQPVPPLLGQVLAARSGRPPVEVGAGTIAAIRQVNLLRTAGWPAPPARWNDPATAPVLCWNWTPDGETVRTASALPMPEGAARVDLAQSDGAGPKVDTVVIGAGAGGPVRATTPGQPAGTGTVWLVSTTGVAYGVADQPTADALGVGQAEPAPEAVLRSLPSGPALDLEAVRRVVDVQASG